MISLSLQACAEALSEKFGAKLIGDDVQFHRVSTDTRTLKPDDLLVALRGEHFDAHDKIDAQVVQAASALVVQRPLPYAISQLLVSDTLRALGYIARQWRKKIHSTVIAITGSNGKTTVKEMTAAILRQKGSVFATQGNLNNEIGMPLSVLSIDEPYNFAVLELGANHRGEIDYLVNIARPHVALINNAGPSHLQGFGSLDGVASAKGEIYAGLADDGIAIVNADDPYAPQWRACAGGRKIISFGFSPAAEVHGVINNDGHLHIDYHQDSVVVDLPLPGLHNAMNALAATAASIAAGASLNHVAIGLANVKPTSGRLEFKPGIFCTEIIDDSYNANPGSLRAGIEVLCDGAGGKRWCVLGDMHELGKEAAALHHAMGSSARQMGVDYLLSVGEFATATISGFGDQGWAFDSLEHLQGYLQSHLQKGDRVLVKGSRGARMERIVQTLVQDNNNNKQNKAQC